MASTVDSVQSTCLAHISRRIYFSHISPTPCSLIPLVAHPLNPPPSPTDCPDADSLNVMADPVDELANSPSNPVDFSRALQ